MCSYIFSSTFFSENSDINCFLAPRGPDATNFVEHNGYYFLHNLLSITGEKSPQPFISPCGDVFCLYIGEIYNYSQFGEYKSDGECLLPLYLKMGTSFTQDLDGEYAITIVDLRKKEVLIATDTFATKPVWLGSNNAQLGVATYQSALHELSLDKCFKVPANTVMRFSLNSFKILSEESVYKFCLKQEKTNYDDWAKSFEEAIHKRTEDVAHKIFIGLSSGYDSGAIACALNKQNRSFHAFTIQASEDIKTLNARQQQLDQHEIIKLSYLDFLEARAAIDYCEPFETDGYNLKHDAAAVGLSHICARASKNNCKIYISGQGADEIIGDYGWNGQKYMENHSQFGGIFPKDLANVFPYKNFFGGTQLKWINKEEYVAGSFGIETRFPFLDKNLVQEFLWLSTNLKNKSYKAPIQKYLFDNNYPFVENVKNWVRSTKQH